MEFFLIRLIFPLVRTVATLAIVCQVASVILVVFLIAERVRGTSNKGIDFIAKNGVILMLIIAFVASVGSLFFSEIALWPPCKLCWLQRIFMYPQVILLGMAFWRKDIRIVPYILFLCLVGMGISMAHYTEQVLAMLNPVKFDPSVPCDLSGVSCKATYIREYGYITIPMLAMTAFVTNALISITSLRLLPKKSGNESRRWRHIVAGIFLVLFVAFLAFAVTNT